MVKSYITMEHEDYQKIVSHINDMEESMKMYEETKSLRCLDAVNHSISTIKELLKEE